jgi:hypothetical protein
VFLWQIRETSAQDATGTDTYWSFIFEDDDPTNDPIFWLEKDFFIKGEMMNSAITGKYLQVLVKPYWSDEWICIGEVYNDEEYEQLIEEFIISNLQ